MEKGYYLHVNNGWCITPLGFFEDYDEMIAACKSYYAEHYADAPDSVLKNVVFTFGKEIVPLCLIR